MSCQDILAMRKLITQKYDEYEPHLNPFCRMLFCDNWQWPSSYLSQNPQQRSKNLSSKTSLKTDITSWFLSLGSRQKCAFTTIKNPKFLLAFLQTYHKSAPNMLYHIYQKREIPDYISKNTEDSTFKKIIQYLRIAWLDEPIIYFQISEDQIQGLFLEFMNWMDEISSNKIFEYAHKIKSKNQPEENLLWFTEQSFQQLQAWLINQFERIITKNYFDKSNFEVDVYDKISRLKQGVNKKIQYNVGISQTSKKQLQKLLSMKIQDTQNISSQEYASFQIKVKVYEDRYYEEAALLMDYENSGEGDKEDANKKKKKKNKKRKNKQKPKEKQIINSTQNISNEDMPKSDQQLKQEVSDIKLITSEQQLITKQQQQVLPVYEEQCEHQIQKGEDNELKQQPVLNTDGESDPLKQSIIQQNQQEYNDYLRNKQDENSLDKISVFQELESSQSVCSSQWSDLAYKNKYITNKNSTGKSHPQFYQNKQQFIELEQTRSLSQQTDNIQIASRGVVRTSKLKKKQQKLSPRKKDSQKFYKKHSQHSLMSHDNQQCSESSIIAVQYGFTSNQSEFVRESGSDQDLKNSNLNSIQNEDIHKKQYPQEQKHGKKRRKKNKTLTLQREFSKKMSATLINKQLNQFVDNLSLQTNNLYDYKRVSFERVRYFIQSLFPTTQSMLFGSNAVGLSLPTSDIDIMLYNLPCYSKEEAGQILAHLAVQINTMAWIVSCSAYLTAKVPLVKLQIDSSIPYSATKRKCDYIVWPMNINYLQLMPKKQNKNETCIIQGCQKPKQYKQKKNSGFQLETEKTHNTHNNKIIKVDLSVNLNDEGNLGTQSTQLMKKWMAQYPQIQRAVIAFKYILVQRGYSSNFRGGIGSYCLFIMIAAFFKEFPQLQQLDDGEFLMAILKFYGQQFENHLKSIRLLSLDQEQSETMMKEQENQTESIYKKSCFLSLQETNNLILSQNRQKGSNNLGIDPHQEQMLYHIRENPLKIFDPINNRIMSGSCQMYPQIKTDFRRIYNQMKQIELQIQQQVQMNLNSSEITKMFENKKCFDKWLNKYQTRSRFSIKKILNNGS